MLAAMLAIGGCGNSSNTSTFGSAAPAKAKQPASGREHHETRAPVPASGEGRTAPKERPPAEPQRPPAEPVYAGLSVYQHRCSHITRSGAFAHVVYVPDVAMTRGSTAAVTAAVTLDRSVVPERVLRSARATEAPAIVVSCIVDARLAGSEYAFTINDRSWQARSFLIANTARWAWYVSPKIGGDQALSLEVRPIVSVRYASNRSPPVSAANASLETYPVKVHVDVPWTERPAELVSRVADTLKVAQGLVEAMTGLLVALAGLLTAAGIRRKRVKHESADEPAG